MPRSNMESARGQDEHSHGRSLRYKPPLPLHALSGAETARDLVAARLETEYAARGFTPPFPTWPFTDSAFESAIGFSPRQPLKACDRHLQQCITAGKVTLCETFDPAQPLPRQDEDKTAKFSIRFTRTNSRPP